MIKKINYVLLTLYLIFLIYYVYIVYTQVINLSNSNGGFIFAPFLLVIHLLIFLIFISPIISSSKLISNFSKPEIVSLKSTLARLLQHFFTLGFGLIGLAIGQNTGVPIPLILSICIIIFSIYEFFANLKLISNQRLYNSSHTHHTVSAENILNTTNESQQTQSMIHNDHLQEIRVSDSNTVINDQEYTLRSTPNETRNLIFSTLLILGFLAFALLSWGGIVAGDLTVSGVLLVASIILIIDGYLFYLMWFKK